MTAEIHYFPTKLFKGFLYKNEPEVVVDSIWAVFNKPYIPIILQIKDSHKFPIYIHKLEIAISSENKTTTHTIEINQKFSSIYECKIFYINIENFIYTLFSLNPTSQKQFFKLKIKAKIYASINGKDISFINTNIVRNPKNIEIYYILEDYPRISEFYSIDFHVHSNFTEDFVEFGASVECYDKIKNFIDLDYFVITDHSYDLDDRIGEFFSKTATFEKWEKLKELNSKVKSMILSEELSVGNSKNQNVHLIILDENLEKPYIGKGDGGEELFRNKPNIYLTDIKSKIKIAAHPTEKIPFAHKILLNRGNYSFNELLNEVDGIEFLNRFPWLTFEKDIKILDKILQEKLKNKKEPPFLVAGNDSHGYFSIGYYIKMPLFKISTNKSHLFGRNRTFIKEFRNFNELINNLRSSSFSTGGFITIDKENLKIYAKSSNFFGNIKYLILKEITTEKINTYTFKFNHLEIDVDIKEKLTFYSSFPIFVYAILITNKNNISISNIIEIN